MSNPPGDRAPLAVARESGGSRRVLLHVGAPKSGTTYLQDRLAANRELLTEQGLHYVDTRTGNHFQAALDLIQRPWAGELKRAQGQWQALVEAARHCRGDVLVSHEILAAATPAQVRRAFDSFPGDELHVVVTARDLGRQLPAEWQETVKHRAAWPWRQFVGKVRKARRRHSRMWFWRVQSLPDVLTRWGTGLRPDQVHVVTVPPAGSPPGVLWQRFGAVVGLDPDREYAEAENTNPSLGIADIAVIRRLNKLLKSAEVRREVYVPLVRELVARDTFAEHRDREPAVVPPRHRRFVERVTREWVDWIQGSGVDVVGDLDDLRPRWPTDDSGLAHPDEPDEAQVAESAIEALAAVLVEWDRQAPDHSGVRRVARYAAHRLHGS